MSVVRLWKMALAAAEEQTVGLKVDEESPAEVVLIAAGCGSGLIRVRVWWGDGWFRSRSVLEREPARLAHGFGMCPGWGGEGA